MGEKFHVGQVIKNYKAWCELLGQKERGGKSKQLHIKELERFFRFHREGQKFIIDEIYSEPKPKIDNRNGGNNTKYGNLMDCSIIDALSKESVIEASKTDLYKKYIPLYTDYYNSLFVDVKDFAKDNELGKGATEKYLGKLNSIVTTATKTALDRLEKLDIIKWSLQILVKDNPSPTNDYYAEGEMLQVIKDCEAMAYDEMQIRPFDRVNINVNKKFKKMVCDYINDDKRTKNTSIYNYWKVYYIELLKELDEIDIPEPNIEELKSRFAISICKAVKNYEMFDEEKEEYYCPYNYEKYDEQLNKLNSLVFGFSNNQINLEDLNFDNIPF